RGRNGLHAAAVMLNAIGTWHKADDLHRLKACRPRIDRIGSDIADHVRAQRQRVTFAVEAKLGIHDLIEALAVRREVFHPVAGPFDGATEMAGHGADENLLRIKRAFAAETTAHVRSDHADLVARNVERRRQRITYDARHLRGTVKRQRIASRIVFGKTGARLDRNRRLAVHAEAALDANWRGVERS